MELPSVPINFLIDEIKRSLKASRQTAKLASIVNDAIGDGKANLDAFNAEIVVFEGILKQLEESNDRIVKHVDAIITELEQVGKEKPSA